MVSVLNGKFSLIGCQTVQKFLKFSIQNWTHFFSRQSTQLHVAVIRSQSFKIDTPTTFFQHFENYSYLNAEWFIIQLKQRPYFLAKTHTPAFIYRRRGIREANFIRMWNKSYELGYQLKILYVSLYNGNLISKKLRIPSIPINQINKTVYSKRRNECEFTRV